MEHPKFIQNIDWKLLREQKSKLVHLTYVNYRSEHSILEGIIHLIDAVQDYAVDKMGIDSKEVFDLIPEDEGDDLPSYGIAQETGEFD